MSRFSGVPQKAEQVIKVPLNQFRLATGQSERWYVGTNMDDDLLGGGWEGSQEIRELIHNLCDRSSWKAVGCRIEEMYVSHNGITHNQGSWWEKRLRTGRREWLELRLPWVGGWRELRVKYLFIYLFIY